MPRSRRRSSSSGERSARVAEADRRRDEGEDGIAVGRGDEVDEVDAVGEPVDLVGGGPDREPGLAAPAGPGERDEADVGVVQALADRAGAPRRGRRTRMSRSGGCSAGGRGSTAAGTQPAGPDGRAGRAAPAGRGPSADAPRGRAASRRPGAGRSTKRGGRLRQQDLAAVTGRHDPRGPVDRGPEVVAAARLGLAGVDPHPDADRAPVRPRLARRARAGRRSRRVTASTGTAKTAIIPSPVVLTTSPPDSAIADRMIASCRSRADRIVSRVLPPTGGCCPRRP